MTGLDFEDDAFSSRSDALHSFSDLEAALGGDDLHAHCALLAAKSGLQQLYSGCVARVIDDALACQRAEVE
eukprot:6398779-Karenia_brevis.AAC.1